MMRTDESMESNGLFRQEALEAARTPWLGHIRLATPISHVVWAAGSAAFGAALIALICFGAYTRRERVTGLLLPRAGLIQVTSWAPGVIKEIPVREGDLVRAGQPLISVSGEHVSERLGDTVEHVSASMEKQRDKLRADISGAKALAEEQVRGLEQQKKSLIDQISQDDELLKIYKLDESAESTLLDQMKGLYKHGYVSQIQFNQQQSVMLSAQAQVKNAMKSRAESAQELASLSDQIIQIPMTTEAKVRDLERQLEQLGQSLYLNEANRLFVQRASQAGIVSSILVKQGQTVANGQALMAEVPANSPLQAVLLVPSKAIGFVSKGSKVALHYDAYPYQKFGVQDGFVESVSANALSPKQIADLTGQPAPTEAQYEVVVTLAAQSINAYGDTKTLVSGMTLSADVLLDRRKLIEWIFEPLYGMKKSNHAD